MSIEGLFQELIEAIRKGAATHPTDLLQAEDMAAELGRVVPKDVVVIFRRLKGMSKKAATKKPGFETKETLDARRVRAEVAMRRHTRAAEARARVKSRLEDASLIETLASKHRQTLAEFYLVLDKELEDVDEELDRLDEDDADVCPF